MSARPRRKRRRILGGWGLFILAVVLLAAVVWVDAQWKAGAPHDGFCPDDARWIVATGDFAALWRETAESEAVRRLCEEWRRPLRHLELAVRKKAGIRPTPQRWQLWCGNRFLMARADGAMGLCVYPGLLARAVHLANRVSLRANGRDGVYRFGDLRYAWRDGYLIVSESHDYVAAALRASPLSLEPESDPADVRVAWRGDREGWLRLSPGGRFHVEGRVRAAITQRETPLTLPNAWAEPPLFTVTASSAGDVAAVLACLEEPVREYAEWHYVRDAAHAVWTRWGMADAGEGWDAQADQCSLALTDVDTSVPLPVPELALVMRCTRPVSGDHPLKAVLSTLESVPYEWKGQPGEYMALLGDQLAPCVAGHDRDWILTTREPLMRELMGRLAPGPAIVADATVRLDWSRAGDVAASVLGALGDLELIPGHGKNDVNEELAPIARGAAQLGRLELDAYCDGDWMRFEGALVTAIEESAP